MNLRRKHSYFSYLLTNEEQNGVIEKLSGGDIHYKNRGMKGAVS